VTTRRPAPNLHSCPIQRRSDRIRSEPLFKRISYPMEKQMGATIDKAKGKIKQATGILAGDKKLESEGRADEAKGKVKGAVEDVKRTVKRAMKS
jgi:uncharacterized protein YjbJ (UPF0337 family)